MVNAFKEIRLTSSYINATGGQLKVNNELVTYQSETGRLLNYSGVLDNRLHQTGVNLLALINASSAGVGSIDGLSGNLDITGAGNIVTTINGSTIILSGDVSSLATIVNLSSTGSTLYNYINNFSGVFNNSGAAYQIQINTNVANIAATGISLKNTSNLISGNLITTGQTLYNDIVGLSGVVDNNSANLQTTGSNLYNYIRNFSGNQQSFSTGIDPIGFDNYYVGFPLGNFATTPRVFPSVEVPGNIMYSVNITGRSTAGFYALFSDTVQESGVILHIFATINS